MYLVNRFRSSKTFFKTEKIIKIFAEVLKNGEMISCDPNCSKNSYQNESESKTTLLIYELELVCIV